MLHGNNLLVCLSVNLKKTSYRDFINEKEMLNTTYPGQKIPYQLENIVGCYVMTEIIALYGNSLKGSCSSRSVSPTR